MIQTSLLTLQVSVNMDSRWWSQLSLQPDLAPFPQFAQVKAHSCGDAVVSQAKTLSDEGERAMNLE